MTRNVRIGWAIAIVVALLIAAVTWIRYQPASDEPVNTEATSSSSTALPPEGVESTPVFGDEQQMQDLQSIAEQVTRLYYTLPMQAGDIETLEPLATQGFIEVFTVTHTDTPEWVSIAVDDITFSDLQPRPDSSTEQTLRAAVTTTTTYNEEDIEKVTNTAIITFRLKDGWRVNSITEVSGIPESGEP